MTAGSIATSRSRFCPALSGLTLRGSDFSPEFLPDGHHFLYYVRGNPEVRGIYAGALDGTLEARRLLDSDTGAVYAGSGHLLFVRQGTLYSQAFDPDAMAVSGRPAPLAEHVANSTGRPTVSVSRGGSIAYRASSADQHGSSPGSIGPASSSAR
jgi:hypothetical protein